MKKNILFLLCALSTVFPHVSAATINYRKIVRTATKTSKIGSHCVELVTGVALAAGTIFWIWNLKNDIIEDKSPVPIGGSIAGGIASTTLIINGIRGLAHELKIGKHKKQTLYTLPVTAG